MKKAVFFDIDGTLCNEYMQLPESTVCAVRKLRENGHYAFICSGRSRANIRNPKLLEIGFDGIVAACGSHIDLREEKTFEQLWTKEQVAHVLSVTRRHHMPVVLEGPQHIYVDEKEFADDPYVIYLRKELGEDIRTIEDSTEIRMNKMSALLNGADAGEIIREFGEDFDVILHNEELIEVNLNGCSKVTGIQRVCRMLDIPLESTYAFGDSANDVGMLQYVAHGIAMGNGTDAAKQAADFVTTDIMEDGIKNGLAHYGLI